MALRPIGTEYTTEFFDPYSTDPLHYRLTWRVVDHVECEHNYRTVIAEKVEVVKKEVIE